MDLIGISKLTIAHCHHTHVEPCSSGPRKMDKDRPPVLPDHRLNLRYSISCLSELRPYFQCTHLLWDSCETNATPGGAQLISMLSAQVSYDYFENAMAFFTTAIYIAIKVG